MRVFCIFAGALLLCACGGNTPPPSAPELEPVPVPSRPPPKELSVSQELGSLDPSAVERTWNDLRADFEACRQRGVKSVEVLDGDVKLFARVGADGTTRWAMLEDSTLGDRDTEKCMVDAIMQARWPKPVGGEGETRNTFGFDPSGRPATAWSADRIGAVLGKNERDLMKCKRGVRGSFHVTVYVEPHKKEGRVQSVGVAAPSKEAVEKIDCIVDEVKSWKMPSPGSWVAKVDFRI
jgi:hypothetical protein